ncbi:MAG: class I SAM-dependent methyltransferase family protein [Candidatus Micrarchaeota archaeon]|nr:class I SAM-dependent methyltransferase family protein [Candidatus Micrarchaeota archaeon]MDE1846465.1 class I SAM-dependent methyltransferase family protein [Candidatus Micrarchaeota archaeon]
MNKKQAEKARHYLEVHAQLSTKHKIYGDNSFIYLPIGPSADDKTARAAAKKLGASLVEKGFEKLRERSAYRQILAKELGEKYAEVTKSYDLIGNIALIDAEGSAAKKIASAIMQTNRNIQTVISKGGAVKGRYRTRSYRHVAGKRNFVATYKENGAVLKFDIRKTFFSSRLAYDRLRIAKLVKDNENVLVMFAGMGPFAIEIGIMHKGANVVGIELNRSAYGYMRQNIILNRLKNVTAEVGDVKKAVAKYRGFADRIVMPLPKDAYDFLGSALTAAKRRCIIHYYGFGGKDSAYSEHEQKVRRFFESKGVKVKVIGRREVRKYSPAEIEVVIDFQISKPR